MGRAVERIYNLFPSSMSGPVLLELGQGAVLYNGERYSYVTIVNDVSHERSGFFCLCDLQFASGRKKQDLCSLSYSVHISPLRTIFHIEEMTTSIVGGITRTDHLHYFDDPEMTDPPTFQLVLQQIENIFADTVDAKVTPLSDNDPLIDDPVTQISVVLVRNRLIPPEP